ncbi:MAG: iron-containing redox enzyme family protein, partial [Actinomycetota bacterium]|nr:iron-containing redox enzyme family protein [Actinomycetota bacterium]
MFPCNARGPLSAAIIAALQNPAGPAPELDEAARCAVAASVDLVGDEDIQLALYLMYELHYGALPVDERWEWSGDLLGARAVLEDGLEGFLRRAYDQHGPHPLPQDLPATLFALAAPGPSAGSVASYVARQASREQVRELLMLRSVSQLKEADPHTWAIPRLRGRAKAALVEIQADEYGGGRLDRMHSALFARCMRALGLSDEPNSYLERVPAGFLAGVNVVSMFALHSRLRGALCGHLAAFEMTSSLPSRRFVTGLQRLGLGLEATEYFDEHVEADAVHEQVAAHDLCGGLVEQEPSLVGDVLFGARTALGLDAHAGTLVMRSWSTDRSALREGPVDRAELVGADAG